MKNVANFFKNIKQGLKNPKTKSLTLLGIYALFFLFVFIVFNQSKSISSVDNYEEETPVGIISYEYEYIFNLDGEEDSIIGTHNDNKDLFKIGDKSYYMEDDNVIDLDNKDSIIDLFYNINNYSYSNIEELIKNSTYKEKTTYKDESSKTIYSINITDLNKYFNLNNECLYNICGDVVIDLIVEESKYIDNVTIDLSNYYRYDYLIKLSYSNINNIEDIKINTLTE